MPFHRYGSLFAQTLTEVLEVSNEVTVRFKVAIVSQPVALDKVSMKVPAAVKDLPFQRYGSLFAHTLTEVLEVSSGVTVRFKVAIVSQPVALDKVSMKVPAAVYDLPFQKYGSLFAQTLTEVLEVSNGVTVRFKVAIVSQPVALDSVSVKIPATVYDLPFQMYGSLFAQTLTEVLEVSNGVTVRFNVAIVSQPVALDNVSMKIPAAV